VKPSALSGPFQVTVSGADRKPAREDDAQHQRQQRATGGDVTLFANVSGAFHQPTPTGTVSSVTTVRPFPVAPLWPSLSKDK